MSKLKLATIGSRYASVAALNANFAAIVAAIEKTISRDGSTPNAMEADLDMNSKRIVNVADAVNPRDVPSFRQLTSILGGAVDGNVAVLTELQTARVNQNVFVLEGLTYLPGANHLSVYVNGIRLNPSQYTEYSENIVITSSPLNSGDKIYFITNDQLFVNTPVNIAGGRIDGCVIGENNPNTGTFTTLHANQLSLSGSFIAGGGAFFGPVVVPAGAAGNQAPRKSDVDAAIAAAPFVKKAGDVMTGQLTLAGPPLTSSQAATKLYVDQNSGGGPIVIENYTSDVVGDAQPTVHQAWNAQADASNIIRKDNELSFYRWPSDGQDTYRYAGSERQPPYTSTENDWVIIQLDIDSPLDGTTYGRIDGEWQRVININGGTMLGHIILPSGAAGQQAQSAAGAQTAVDAKMAGHIADNDPHPQYANQTRGDARYLQITDYNPGVGAHSQLTGLSADDHPHYLNQTRADARYDLLGAGTTAVGNHVALADPHTQYALEADISSVYMPKAGGAFTGAISVPPGATGNQVPQAAEIANYVDTGLNAHINSADPHSQYITEAEGITYFEPIGGGAAAVAGHVGVGDPHTQYLLETVAPTIYEQLGSKGAANGYCPLDGSSLVPASLLPITGLQFKGSWDASGGALPPDTDDGSMYLISVAGTINVVPPAGTTPTPTPVEVGDIIVYSASETYWYKASFTFAALDSRYLQLSGGTMTGALHVPPGAVGTAVPQAQEIANYVNDGIYNHAAAADPHSVYLLKTDAGQTYVPIAGGSMLGPLNAFAGGTGSNVIQSDEVNQRDAATMNAHLGDADPHTQYLTSTRGFALYDPVGAAAGAVASHVSEGDPHPQYLTPAEGGSLYEPINAAANAIAAHVQVADPHPTYTTNAEATSIAVAQIAGLVARSNTWPLPQRTVPVTVPENLGTMDMNVAEDFFLSTPTTPITIDFVNLAVGQRGMIYLPNTGGQPISFGSVVLKGEDAEVALSEPGYYQCSYWCINANQVTFTYSEALI